MAVNNKTEKAREILREIGRDGTIAEFREKAEGLEIPDNYYYKLRPQVWAEEASPPYEMAPPPQGVVAAASPPNSIVDVLLAGKDFIRKVGGKERAKQVLDLIGD